MAQPPRLHFRVDPDLDALVRAYADKNDVSVSEACRILLRTTLENDDSKAAATEAIYTFRAMYRRVVSRMAAEMQDQFPLILDEELEAIRSK